MTFAFIFDSVGGTEWLVLLGVILIVVGPKNLPAAARKFGQIMAQLRRAADEFKRQITEPVNAGKPKADAMRGYDPSKSTADRFRFTSFESESESESESAPFSLTIYHVNINQVT